MSPRKSSTLLEIRQQFAASKWTYGTAARHLGVDKGHLHHVLHGKRHSAALLRRVATLPTQPQSSPISPARRTIRKS